MDRATEELVKAFGEDEERSSQGREKAAIGAILVDKNGVLVEGNGIAVSSFAWALPLPVDDLQHRSCGKFGNGLFQQSQESGVANSRNQSLQAVSFVKSAGQRGNPLGLPRLENSIPHCFSRGDSRELS